MLKWSWSDPDLTAVEFPKLHVRRWNFQNCLAAFALGLDTYQMMSFAFLARGFPPSQSVATGFTVSFLNFNLSSLDSVNILFIFFMVLSLLWIGLAGHLHLAAIRNDPHMLDVVPALDDLVDILSNTLYLTISSNLMKFLVCDYSTVATGGKPFLISYPEIVCWEGTHRTFAMVALWLLLGYVVSANYIGVFFLVRVLIVCHVLSCAVGTGTAVSCYDVTVSV